MKDRFGVMGLHAKTLKIVYDRNMHKLKKYKFLKIKSKLFEINL